MEQYTMRKLSGQDLFPMLKILSRVKAKDMVLSFIKKREEISKKLQVEQQTVKPLGEESTVINVSQGLSEDETKEVGMEVFADIVETIMCNLDLAKDDINNLLANLCNVNIEQIQTLDMGPYTELLMEFFGKEELKDFFKCISSSSVFRNLK